MWPILLDWVRFKSYHDLSTFHEYAAEAANLAYEATINMPVDHTPVKMGSLYYYYKTLPQEMQDNQSLKDVYLGLEYSCADKSLQEK
jgi:hypothetical protein